MVQTLLPTVELDKEGYYGLPIIKFPDDYHQYAVAIPGKAEAAARAIASQCLHRIDADLLCTYLGMIPQANGLVQLMQKYIFDDEVPAVKDAIADVAGLVEAAIQYHGVEHFLLTFAYQKQLTLADFPQYREAIVQLLELPKSDDVKIYKLY